VGIRIRTASASVSISIGFRNGIIKRPYRHPHQQASRIDIGFRTGIGIGFRIGISKHPYRHPSSHQEQHRRRQRC
jgi:hypothetical protein